MFARLAVACIVVAGCGLPAKAMVMEQPDQHLYAFTMTSEKNAVVVDPFILPVFSMTAPEMVSGPGPVAKIFTVPNILVALLGFAWMTLVRRRLNDAQRP